MENWYGLGKEDWRGRPGWPETGREKISGEKS